MSKPTKQELADCSETVRVYIRQQASEIKKQTRRLSAAKKDLADYDDKQRIKLNEMKEAFRQEIARYTEVALGMREQLRAAVARLKDYDAMWEKMGEQINKSRIVGPDGEPLAPVEQEVLPALKVLQDEANAPVVDK